MTYFCRPLSRVGWVFLHAMGMEEGRGGMGEEVCRRYGGYMLGDMEWRRKGGMEEEGGMKEGVGG